jgi:hypothetical protein
MNIVQNVQHTALSTTLALLPVSGSESPLRALVSLNAGGEVKPLMLVGNLHAGYEDGYVIAILNPDPSLVDEVKPGVAIPTFLLNERVRKRCDLALMIVLNGPKASEASVIRCYTSRTPQPAKFAVR